MQHPNICLSSHPHMNILFESLIYISHEQVRKEKKRKNEKYVVSK